MDLRWKIIVANAVIVLLVGVLSYAILLTTLADAFSDPSARNLAAERASRAADTQLALDGLRAERWLSAQAIRESVSSVFTIGVPQARSEAATAQANQVMDAAAKAPEFQGMRPSLVVLVDKAGRALGRDNSNTLMRGDELAVIYPSLQASLQSGAARSALWLNRQRQEQLFVSYAPVVDASGVLGALVLGVPLNDDRLAHLSRLTSGVPLAIAAELADGVHSVVATSRGLSRDALPDELVRSSSSAALQGGKIVVTSASTSNAESAAAAFAPLSGYFEARATVIALAPQSGLGHLSSTLWPIWGVVALGLVMVAIVGSALGAYMTRPISQLEEGLLSIINGKTDMRFELEHEELGGLVSRINSLLNSLTGVSEADEENRGES
jgi:HAMP domain-containing protein